MKKFCFAWVMYLIGLASDDGFAFESQSAFAQDSVPKCDVEYLFGNCDELNHRQPIFKKYDDGTWLPNIGQIFTNKTSSSISKSPAITSNQKQDLANLDKPIIEGSPEHTRTLNVFEKVKRSVISVILDGKDENDPTLTENQVNLLNRIKTVKIVFSSDLGICPESVPTAGFYPSSHTIGVCSATARSPENLAFMLLAHEFGHVVDPCIVRQGLYKVKKQFPQIPICKNSKIENRTTRDNLSKTEFTVATSDQDAEGLPFRNDKGLIDCGFVEPIAKAKPILTSDHTIHSLLMDCVRNHIKVKLDSGFDIHQYYRGPTEEEYFQQILVAADLDTIEKQQSALDTPQKLGRFRTLEFEVRRRFRDQMSIIQKNLEDLHESNKGKMLNCSDTTKTQETFADLLATRAFEVKLNNERVEKLSKEEGKNATMLFASLECANQQTGGKLNKRITPNYPSLAERLSMVFQNRRIQEALGCRYEGSSVCETEQDEESGFRKKGSQ